MPDNTLTTTTPTPAGALAPATGSEPGTGPAHEPGAPQTVPEALAYLLWALRTLSHARLLSLAQLAYDLAQHAEDHRHG